MQYVLSDIALVRLSFMSKDLPHYSNKRGIFEKFPANPLVFALGIIDKERMESESKVP